MPYKTHMCEWEETRMKSSLTKEISGDRNVVENNDGLKWYCRDNPLKADLPSNSIEGRELFVWHWCDNSEQFIIREITIHSISKTENHPVPLHSVLVNPRVYKIEVNFNKFGKKKKIKLSGLFSIASLILMYMYWNCLWQVENKQRKKTHMES